MLDVLVLLSIGLVMRQVSQFVDSIARLIHEIKH